MRIADLRIQEFRGVKSAFITFSNHTVLIGPNNCGKSTIIEALALLFGRDRLIRDLTEHDFFGSDPSAPDRIKVIATLTGFASDDPNRNFDWFREERAVPKWLDDATGILHPDNAVGRKLACQIGVGARFNRDSLEVEVIRYFHDDDSIQDVFAPDIVRRVPQQIIRDVGFFLVPANRTWDRTISFGSELFRRVVSSIGGQPAAAVLEERRRLRGPAQPLEKDPGLASIIASVEAELGGIVGKSVNLLLRLTATDSDAVLDAVVPHYAIEGQHQIPARRQGSGLVSLQHALLLLSFGRLRASQGKSFMMAIEEPELHVPPPLQRRLVHRIRSLSTQTIIVTHSPVVASACEPTSIRVLHNSSGTLKAEPFIKSPLVRGAPNWKRTLYIVKRQETLTALMHEIVLVPEGRIDFDLLSLLVNAGETRGLPKVDASIRTEFGAVVGVVPTADSQIAGVYKELSAIHRQVLCFVDGDEEGTSYISSLAKLASPPKRILQLPDKWTIEDLIGWIAEANVSETLPELNAQLGLTLKSVSEGVALLKKKPKEGGLKGDPVVYEIIVNCLADIPASLARIQKFLSCTSEACMKLSNAPQGWALQQSSTAQTSVVRFAP